VFCIYREPKQCHLTTVESITYETGARSERGSKVGSKVRSDRRVRKTGAGSRVLRSGVGRLSILDGSLSILDGSRVLRSIGGLSVSDGLLTGLSISDGSSNSRSDNTRRVERDWGSNGS